MTVASKSRKRIIETYEKYDRRLTLITFDTNGYRRMTYSSYGFHDIALHMMKQANRGFTVQIYIDLPDYLHTPKTLDDLPAKGMYLFKPTEVF